MSFLRASTRLLQGQERGVLSPPCYFLLGVSLDSRDLEIVRELVRDARTSLTAIAKKLGLSEAAVRKRLAKLEREGVIEGY